MRGFKFYPPRWASVGLVALALASCTTVPAPTPPLVNYQPLTWAEALNQVPTLANQWAATWPAWAASCIAMQKRPVAQPLLTDQPVFGTFGVWQQHCQALAAQAHDPAAQWAYVQTHFAPVAVKPTTGQGFFTGYYEPFLRGQFQPSATFATPLYRRPADHLTIDLKQFLPPDHPAADKQLVGRVQGQKVVPYYTRAEIVGFGEAANPARNAALNPLAADVLLWVDDPIAVFFLQIQGSGRVELPGGEVKHIVYAHTNGHPYVAIGRTLVAEQALAPGGVSMPAIADWLKANPAQQARVMNTNPSYVFFDLKDDGPFGAQGVVLTPERSLAVDRRYVPYGVPVVVQTTLSANTPPTPYQQLMVAQDTGGAIRGPARGDIFFGTGPAAERLAGAQQSVGELWALVPRAGPATTAPTSVVPMRAGPTP